MKTAAFTTTILCLAVALPSLAQSTGTSGTQLALAIEPDTASVSDAAADVETAPEIRIQHLRAYDQRGINVFEAPKNDGVPYTGFRLDWGAAFNQPFQALNHSNTAEAKVATNAAGQSYNANELIDIGSGFNLANANLVLNAQVAPGIRVNLETYLSSRHHNETWVKGGYLQIDESPIDLAILHSIMKYTTLKVGMFEINYGDAHFRRSDGGQVVYNAFVENYLLDSFNTEIGAEAYFRTGPWLAMVGVTDGQNKGGILTPDQRGPAFIGKVGFDKQITPLVRARLTGSTYHVSKSPSVNLFSGDRTGSHYFFVLENVQATANGQFTSGRLNPGLRNELTSIQVNPFLEVADLELFGLVERATGRAAEEAGDRQWNQYAGDVIYRFLDDALYVGTRYNRVDGELQGIAGKVSADRAAVAAGWFVTPNILLKGEYVRQRYHDFPSTDIRNGGRFDGIVMEAGLSF